MFFFFRVSRIETKENINLGQDYLLLLCYNFYIAGRPSGFIKETFLREMNPMVFIKIQMDVLLGFHMMPSKLPREVNFLNLFSRRTRRPSFDMTTAKY